MKQDPQNDVRTMNLILLLYKFKVAGLKVEKVSVLSNMLTGGPGPNIPFLAIRMNVVSLYMEYLVGCRYRDHDPMIALDMM